MIKPWIRQGVPDKNNGCKDGRDGSDMPMVPGSHLELVSTDLSGEFNFRDSWL